MEAIEAATSKADRLKAELADLRAAHKKREAQKLALLQQVQARDKTSSRKQEAHGKYCLGGAILKYRREVADDVLAQLVADPKAPKGHAVAVQRLLGF